MFSAICLFSLGPRSISEDGLWSKSKSEAAAAGGCSVSSVVDCTEDWDKAVVVVVVSSGPIFFLYSSIARVSSSFALRISAENYNTKLLKNLQMEY